MSWDSGVWILTFPLLCFHHKVFCSKEAASSSQCWASTAVICALFQKMKCCGYIIATSFYLLLLAFICCSYFCLTLLNFCWLLTVFLMLTSLIPFWAGHLPGWAAFTSGLWEAADSSISCSGQCGSWSIFHTRTSPKSDNWTENSSVYTGNVQLMCFSLTGSVR